jgi:hypothetical protein
VREWFRGPKGLGSFLQGPCPAALILAQMGERQIRAGLGEVKCPSCERRVTPTTWPKPAMSDKPPSFHVICPLCYVIFETHEGDYREWSFTVQKKAG